MRSKQTSGSIIPFVLMVPFSTIIFSCDKVKCDKSIKPLYEPGIRADITVEDANGNPLEDHMVCIEMQIIHFFRHSG